MNDMQTLILFQSVLLFEENTRMLKVYHMCFFVFEKEKDNLWENYTRWDVKDKKSHLQNQPLRSTIINACSIVSENHMG